jgi:hypothetical protein
MGDPILISLKLDLNKQIGYFVNFAKPKSAILALPL